MTQYFIIGGFRIDADYLVGRRFEFTNGAAPDVTFVAAKTADDGDDYIHAHAFGGGKQWMNIHLIAAGIEQGILVESERGVPFTNDGKPLAPMAFPVTYYNTKPFYPGARR